MPQHSRPQTALGTAGSAGRTLIATRALAQPPSFAENKGIPDIVLHQSFGADHCVLLVTGHGLDPRQRFDPLPSREPPRLRQQRCVVTGTAAGDRSPAAWGKPCGILNNHPVILSNRRRTFANLYLKPLPRESSPSPARVTWGRMPVRRIIEIGPACSNCQRRSDRPPLNKVPQTCMSRRVLPYGYNTIAPRTANVWKKHKGERSSSSSNHIRPLYPFNIFSPSFGFRSGSLQRSL